MSSEDTQSKPRKQRSTVEFPYSDLDSAVELTCALRDNAGSECTTDQLAAFLKMSATGGTFRLRLSAARMFGFIETERGGIVRLLDLGADAINPDTDAAARATAFLNVELYSKIYEKYRSKLLPPRKGLEREMEAMGVSSKQKDRARQAFERSAEQSGFFGAGEDRLVMPITNRRGQRHEEAEPEPISVSPSKDVKSSLTLHPFIEGLLETLPEPGAEWDVNDQSRWLSTAAGIFGLLYKSANGEVEVTVKKRVSQTSATSE